MARLGGRQWSEAVKPRADTDSSTGLKPEAAAESCRPEADELAASAGSISSGSTSAGEPSCPEEIVLVSGGHKPRETVAGDFVLKRLPGEAHTWGFRDEAVMPGASWHRPEAAGSADPTCAKHSGGDCTE